MDILFFFIILLSVLHCVLSYLLSVCIQEVKVFVPVFLLL